jgi:hypothetical protein
LLTISFHLVNLSGNIPYFCTGFGFDGAIGTAELKGNPVIPALNA